MKSIGAILIAIGLVLMIITGINLVTTKKVVDLGPLEVNKTENHPIHWSPIIGGVLFLGGIALVLGDRKKA
jgi:uncharacterized membrane protein